mmetsp:Transcript_7331/g.11048  ORF Transcript_7331/g.11048 Transcript_7331/m.11048 type:complete len:112 (-) Transcript_7331:747-1082(-)
MAFANPLEREFKRPHMRCIVNSMLLHRVENNGDIIRFFCFNNIYIGPLHFLLHNTTILTMMFIRIYILMKLKRGRQQHYTILAVAGDVSEKGLQYAPLPHLMYVHVHLSHV